ncbi:MAG: hypothetical protein JO218_13300, partial [Burkholderiales bacterium]|nr:hypothetical protein [Burkholderiales bacterium]
MFTIEGFFNPYLPRGQNRLDAVLTVTAKPEGVATGGSQTRVVGFALDVSGSMDGEKIA